MDITIINIISSCSNKNNYYYYYIISILIIILIIIAVVVFMIDITLILQSKQNKKSNVHFSAAHGPKNVIHVGIK